MLPSSVPGFEKDVRKKKSMSKPTSFIERDQMTEKEKKAKRNNAGVKHFLRQEKNRKRMEAEKRAEIYIKLTPGEKLAKAQKAPGKSSKVLEKLKKTYPELSI